MKEWEIWTQGYAVTGNIAGASYHGKAVALTFREACIAVLGDELDDGDRLSVWGCRCFDNETDARKTFG